MGRRQQWTATMHQTAARLLADGCSYRETARTLGVSHSTVMHYLPGRGWTPTQVGSWASAARWWP